MTKCRCSELKVEFDDSEALATIKSREGNARLVLTYHELSFLQAALTARNTVPVDHAD